MFAFMLKLFAEETTTTGAGGMGSTIMYVVMIVLFVAIFYFLIYRPQKKQEKDAANMRDNLQIGDEISTTGGILGRVVKIKDDVVTIETGSDKNKLKIFKWAVRAVEIPVNADEEEEKNEKPAKPEKKSKKSKEDNGEDK